VRPAAGGAPEPPTVELVPDRLYALPLVYELDGRVSSHPAWARGFGSVNCYLLKEGDEALLLETGFPALESDLFARLDPLLAPGTRLSIFVGRNDPSSPGNLPGLIRRYPTSAVYSPLYSDRRWVLADTRPESLRAADPANLLDEVEIRKVGLGQTVAVGAAGTRGVVILRSLLRLLAQVWLYDAETRTLFPCETFGHLWRSSKDQPWLVEDGDRDGTTVEDVCEFLTGTRYWWLCGARAQQVEAPLVELFETLPVHCIAPVYGCMLRGSGTVERHRTLLLDAIRRLASRPVADGVRLASSRARPA
jgi:hypothetical protein